MNKFGKRSNLQPSSDSVIPDKRGRVGDVAEDPGLGCFHSSNTEEMSKDQNAGAA